MQAILFLPGWYPTKIEQYTGDFIQRHARSVALYQSVQVIYVVRDREGKITRRVHEDNFTNGHLSEQIIYYHIPVVPIPVIDKCLSFLRYRKIYKKAVKNYINQHGKPLCTHVHVISKNGMIAWWMKRKWAIPFVISEHWSLYLPGASPNFNELPALFKTSWHKIVRESNGVSVVSKYLGECMKAIDKNIEYTVIPNVVDESVFFPETNRIKKDIVQFIHISSLEYHKNPEDVLKAFGILKETFPSFRLLIFGPYRQDLELLAAKLNLQGQVSFHQEVPQQSLAVFLRQSDLLILYSRYETFGCVLIEANACGVPVIASDLASHHEIITEGINGFFVPGDKPEALAQKLIWFTRQHPVLSREGMVAATLQKYNYPAVGKLFSDFYSSRLNP